MFPVPRADKTTRDIGRSHLGGLLGQPFVSFSPCLPSAPCLKCACDGLSLAAILWPEDRIHTLRTAEEKEKASSTVTVELPLPLVFIKVCKGNWPNSPCFQTPCRSPRSTLVRVIL